VNVRANSAATESATILNKIQTKLITAPLGGRAVLFCLGILLWSSLSFGTTRYIASSAGTFTGGTACNGQTAITPATWNGLSLSAGDISYICGTITASAGGNVLTVPSSGSSGNPISIIFDTGAILQATYFSGTNGAIRINGKSYIVIDGSDTGTACGRQNNATVTCNGIIQNTANGTSLANQQASFGVVISGCTPGCVVKNLNIKNIYVNQGTAPSGSDSAGSATAGVELTGSNTGLQVINNIITTVSIGIQEDYGSNTSNSKVFNHNVISDMHWGINDGAGNGNSDISTGNDFSYNEITNWTNWTCPANGPGCTDKTDTFHTDGMIVYNFSSTVSTFSATMHDNYIHGDLGNGSPTAFIYCAQNASCVMYNNLGISTSSATMSGLFWLDTNKCSDTMYNNTISGVNSNDIGITFGTSTCQLVGDQGKNIIENNIVINVGQGLHDYGVLVNDVGTSDHNVWRTPGGGAPNFNTSDSTSLSFATWQGDGFDANSSTSSPNLNGSYVPQPSSSAIGRGANLNSLLSGVLNTDFYGITRGGGSCTPTVNVSGCWDSGMAMYAPSSPVATPTFSPVAGTYTGTQSVAISTSTAGAALCYTTDGTTPTANGAGTCTHGTTYSTAVSVSSSLTLKAVGSLSGDTDSSVGSAAYVIAATSRNSTAAYGATISGGAVIK